MDVKVLRAILKFIYGGAMDNFDENAVDLLAASEMWQMKDLKNMCETYLLVNYMKVDNVIDVLVMAETYNANILKKGTMEMIVTNSKEVCEQVGWKNKLANTPMLALEIFEAMAA